MGSIPEPLTPISVAQGLSHRSMLDKIDKLRELVGTTIPLPQLIVVGDQSSGKSSVLESLTGFCFPRAAGLCTRYATQITCRREAQPSVTVGIIPRPNADDAVKKKLRAFRRSADMLNSADLGEIFEEANGAMGIRSIDDTSNIDDGALTFSEDILKIEINGPDQPALTVIDVPGIFRTATPGLTTEEDIDLVTSMVKSYMKDSRTIILAVIPCNVDIATQEILKLAREADPIGSRTMGVLTKPDLVPEQAMKRNIVDLIHGKRQDLKLGYCVVKNRGADDPDSTTQKRNAEEAAFFRHEPWSAIAATKRVGIEALKTRLGDLLNQISKKEFPTLKTDIAKRLADCSKKLEGMDAARSDERAQRAYLGKLAANFERIVAYSLNAYYTEDPIFTESLRMRLITRIIELNEAFSQIFSKRGHTRQFEFDENTEEGKMPVELIDVGFEIPEAPPELADIVVMDRFQCPEPSDDSIVNHIEQVFRQSRGPELGTFGGYLLGTIFKEQSKRWEDIVLSHVSDAIVMVHQFILDLLDHVFADAQVKSELYENVLLERLQAAYVQAISHARFLLEIEREGKPSTFNQAFNAELQKGQASRLNMALGAIAIDDDDDDGEVVGVHDVVARFSVNKSNPEQVREYLHDVLKSYYDVSSKRFVDAVCQQVIDHFLLNGKCSPLHVFGTDLVLEIDAGVLEVIAGEDEVTKQERERLAREIDSLQAAIKVIRGS